MGAATSAERASRFVREHVTVDVCVGPRYLYLTDVVTFDEIRVDANVIDLLEGCVWV